MNSHQRKVAKRQRNLMQVGVRASAIEAEALEIKEKLQQKDDLIERFEKVDEALAARVVVAEEALKKETIELAKLKTSFAELVGRVEFLTAELSQKEDQIARLSEVAVDSKSLRRRLQEKQRVIDEQAGQIQRMNTEIKMVKLT